MDPDVGGREGPEGEGELTGNGSGLGVSGGTDEKMRELDSEE